MTAALAIPPLAQDAAALAWSVRSLGELVARLAERHPDTSPRDLRLAATEALIPDVWARDTEIARLRAEADTLRHRLSVAQRELAGLRGAALDVWLGLEAARHGDPTDEVTP